MLPAFFKSLFSKVSQFRHANKESRVQPEAANALPWQVVERRAADPGLFKVDGEANTGKFRKSLLECRTLGLKDGAMSKGRL